MLNRRKLLGVLSLGGLLPFMPKGANANTAPYRIIGATPVTVPTYEISKPLPTKTPFGWLISVELESDIDEINFREREFETGVRYVKFPTEYTLTATFQDNENQETVLVFKTFNLTFEEFNSVKRWRAKAAVIDFASTFDYKMLNESGDRATWVEAMKLNIPGIPEKKTFKLSSITYSEYLGGVPTRG